MNKISLTVNESPEALEAELLEALRKGVVEFYYKKGSTGELRVAHGTLCPKLFDYEFRGGKKAPAGQINYWDVDKHAWRSVKVWNIIRVESFLEERVERRE